MCVLSLNKEDGSEAALKPLLKKVEAFIEGSFFAVYNEH